MAVRFDRATLSKVEETPEGYLRMDASLGRVGVFSYTKPDGSVSREYRPAEEVFAPESIASALGKPITDLHQGALVSAKTVRAHRVGGVLSEARQDGLHLSARLQIEDAPICDAVKSGSRKEISPGYTVREDMTPGVYEGQPYDLVQRDIRYNHFSVLPPGGGRQGPDVSLRLDADAATIQLDSAHVLCDSSPVGIEIDTPAPAAPVKKSMKLGQHEIKLDAADEVIVGAHVAELQARLDKSAGEQAAQAVRLDAAEKALAKVARAELEASASVVLGAEKLDAKSDAEIVAAVVAKEFPSIKLDGQGPEYARALFDAALAQHAKAQTTVRQDAQKLNAALGSGEAPKPSAYQEMLNVRRNMCLLNQGAK